MREVIDIKPQKPDTGMIFIIIFAFSCMTWSLFCPSPAAASASRALSICAKKVIPSLCVFMIAAKMLSKSGIAAILSRAEPLKMLFGVSGAGLAVIFTGLIAGYPTGASVCAGFCESGEMDREEARLLLPYTNCAGAAFLVGAVGGAMFCDVRIGVILFVSQTFSSLLMLILTRARRAEFAERTQKVRAADFGGAGKIIAASVGESGAALVSVSAFVTLFMVVSDAMIYVISLFGTENRVISAIIRGALEITGGLADGAELYGSSPEIAVALSGALVGFAGFSVMMQVGERALIGGIKTDGYLAGKLKLAYLSCAASLALYSIFIIGSAKIALISCIFIFAFIFTSILPKKFHKRVEKSKSMLYNYLI